MNKFNLLTAGIAGKQKTPTVLSDCRSWIGLAVNYRNIRACELLILHRLTGLSMMEQHQIR